MSSASVQPRQAGAVFLARLAAEPDRSIGQVAIETLLVVLENSRASTVALLSKELEEAVEQILETDHSQASVRSASEIFRRFISLAADKHSTDFLADFRERGQHFAQRVATSRDRIARFSRDFFTDDQRILTHSYSKCVLHGLLAAHKDGVANMHVFVAESRPDESGRKMAEALKEAGVKATVVLDSAVAYLMESIDMVLVGAEGVVETGGVINKIGTLGVAVAAAAFHKPLYVMAESIKFVKEFPLNQADIADEFKYRTSVLVRSKSNPSELEDAHPQVDYTPPRYVQLLFTDLGILTPAAVGDELIKLYT